MTEQELINRLDKLSAGEKQAFILNTIESYPNYQRFKNRLANLFITRGKLRKAKKILVKELNKKYNIHLQITLANLELKDKNLVAARKNIELLRQNNPNTPYGYVLLGRLNNREGHKAAAIDAFQKAHKINPKISGPVFQLFEIYKKEGAFDKAKSIIESGLKQEPDNYFYRMRLAQISRDLGDTKSALSEYAKARELATNDTQAGHAALQLVLVNKEQYSEIEIIEGLRKFSEQYPSHVALRLNLVRFLTNGKLFKEALVEIETIERLDPKDIRATASKATIYSRQGLNNEAELLCDTILSQNPTQLNSLLLKANLLRINEQIKESFLLYEKGIEAHPISPWPYVGLAQLLYLEGDLEEALSVLKRGIAKANHINPIRNKQIQFLMNAGELKMAFSLIEKQEQNSNPFDPQIKYLEVQLFQRKGNFHKAKELTNKYLGECSKDSAWEIRYSSFLSATAFLEYDYPTSEKILTDLVKRADDANMMHNRLSLLYILKGDLEKAKKQLNIATQEIEEKEMAGKVHIPLIGHTAKILNEIQINPRLKVKAVKCFEYSGSKRLNYLAKLNAEHPDYFGFSLYLSNELRSQGVFEKIKTELLQSPTEQSIPKTIIQYWDTDTPPASVKNIMRSWEEHNPNYEYRLFSRKSAYYFLKVQCGREDAQAFLNCEHPAMQADFFRLAYLSKLGGFYADADDKCVKSLDSLVECGAELVLKLGDFGCISNNFLGSAPGNKIIVDAYLKGNKNMTSYFNEGPWFKLGPGHLTKSVTYKLSHHIEEEDFSKWPKIFMLDQIETRKYISQHLSLPYKSSDKSWFTAEYKKTITKTKSA